MAKVIFFFISVGILVQHVSFGKFLRKQYQQSMRLSQADCEEPGTVFARDDCLNCRPTCRRPQGSPNCTLDTCAMGCVCPEGHAWDPLTIPGVLNNFYPECIPLEECPKCPPNEVYDDHMRVRNNCEHTCEQPGPYRICTMMAFSHISCTCADGFVRNQENNKCIPVEECPNREAQIRDCLREFRCHSFNGTIIYHGIFDYYDRESERVERESVIQQFLHKMPPEAGLSQYP